MRRNLERAGLRNVITGGRGWSGELVLAGLLAGVLLSPAMGQGPVVSLRREPVQLLGAEKFQVNLTLEPKRVQVISAASDGLILSVQAAPGETVAAGRDCVALDSTRQKEVVRRAMALLEVARIEQKIASEKGEKSQEELANARLEAAEAEMQLAKIDLEALTCRSPFQGLVVKQHVFPGQYVRAGDPVLTLADVAEFTAEVPVDRGTTKIGQEIEVLTDQEVLKGKVAALLPAGEKLSALRQIIPGLATAVVGLENSSGKLTPGQTVYSRLVPQDAVTLVPTGVVVSHTEGKRKVQVLRNGVVRDVVVEALAQKGTERVYVSGAFGPTDELLISSSQPLKDGQKLTAAEEPASEEATGSATTSTSPSGTAKPPGTTKPAAPKNPAGGL